MKRIMSIFIILTIFITPVFAKDNTITISGGELTTEEDIAVIISLPDISAAFGSITLSYDNKRLEPVSFEFSPAFKAVSPLLNLHYAENQIKFNWLTLGGSIDFTDCVTITFKGIAGGKSKVEVLKAELYDINETKLDVSSASEEINIIGEPPVEDEPADTPDTDSSGSGSSGSQSGSSGGTNHGTSRPSSSRPSGSVSDKGSPVTGTSSTITEEAEKTTPKKSFDDIEGVSWAKESIEFLAGKGIINGVSDTEFAPDKNIKRADFMLLLIKMLGLEDDFEDNFDDVTPDKYYYNAVGIAKKLQLTSGVGDNKFNPEKSITRQELFVIAHRILEMQNAALEAAEIFELEVFEDYGEISEYALPSLAVMVKNKLVSGSGGNIMPLGNATRAETAVIIKRMYAVIYK